MRSFARNSLLSSSGSCTVASLSRGRGPSEPSQHQVAGASQSSIDLRSERDGSMVVLPLRGAALGIELGVTKTELAKTELEQTELEPD